MDLPGALERAHGDAAAAQHARYTAALATFADTYGPGPVRVFRAPGRVNLIGEHTDYNHGYVLPVALDRDVLLLARPRPDQTVHLHNVEPAFAPQAFAIGPAIPPAPRADWSNYARGAAQMVARQAGERVGGMDALIAGAPPYGVPRGAGVSSSSALTVVVALALAHLNPKSQIPNPKSAKPASHILFPASCILSPNCYNAPDGRRHPHPAPGLCRGALPDPDRGGGAAPLSPARAPLRPAL